ncbi:hypothetical protein T484DRAFT_1748026 [Baffinella frigidus]|nr:hypothetical protein T484DRAFT_1748026 [Cryptophyta sp. CCMP2293]
MTGVTSSVLRAVNKPGAGRSRNPDNKSLGLYLDIASPSTPEGSAPGPPTHDTPRASKEPENNHPPQKRSCSDDGDIHSAAHTPSGVFSRVHMARPQPFGELRDAKRVSPPP